MRLHRFFLPGINFESKRIVLTDSALLTQLVSVLRLEPGSEIICVNGEGDEAHVVLESLTTYEAVGVVTKVDANANEPAVRVTLFCSLLKRENFEWVAQKAVEAGVAAIVPLRCQRTVKSGFRRDRLEKIMREAVEQSERGMVPKLHDPVSFTEGLKQAERSDLAVLFHRDGDAWQHVAQQSERTPKTASIFIGPEGGWSDAEIVEAKNADVRMVSLGRLNLRAETAAVVASYLMCHLSS